MPAANLFTYGSINNGQVAGNTFSQQLGTLTSGNGTITGLGTNVSAVKGQLITGTGIPNPNVISAAVTNSATVTTVANQTSSGAQTVTLNNVPVLIGPGEWTGTLAPGATLQSTFWNNTGIIRPVDTGGAFLSNLNLIMGGSVTPGAGAAVDVWFLEANGDGASFESAVANGSTAVSAMPRTADAQIMLANAAYVAGNIAAAKGIPVPAQNFKVVIQNVGTVALPASGAITMDPIAGGAAA